MFINTQFLYLWVSQSISQFATNILVFFISFFVYKQTSSNIAVSGALLSFLIPSFISSILAGILVDRMGKKWVLLISNIIRAFIVFGMFFLEKNFLVLYILIGLLALTTQFFTPAESSLIPKIVPKAKLLVANAYFSITVYLTLIIGFLVSPIFFKFFGYKTVFIIFFMYIIAAIVVYFLKHDEPLFYTNLRQPIKQLALKFNSNFSYILKSFVTDTTINRHVIYVIVIQVVMFVLISLAPGFADKILKIPVEDLSFSIVFPTAVGFLISSILISRIKVKNEEDLTRNSFSILSAVFLFIFLISQFSARNIFNTINFFLLILFGFFSGIIVIMAYANLQKDRGDAGYAGYFGLLNALVNLASIIPVLLSGFLSDYFGVDKIVLLISLLFLIIRLRFKK